MTKPVAKMITPWSGSLPGWVNRFARRARRSRLVEWELVSADVACLNRRAEAAAGVACRKESQYATCDLRPLLGRMFPERFEGYDWWGWCDLDVVLGDLDRLIGQELMNPYNQIVTTDADGIHGPLTLLRSRPDVLDLYRAGPYAEVLANPDYLNFDETGFASPGGGNANPSFTRLVRGAGLRVHYDDRSWTESRDPLPGGAPSRCCRSAHGGRLVEVPTGRDLVLYHFTSKQWPLPNRYKSAYREQQEFLDRQRTLEPLPEESPAYWATRLARVKAAGEPIHKAVLDTNEEAWGRVQAHTAGLLRYYMSPLRRSANVRVLDAGCGYGALLAPLKWANVWCDYVGVDYCPEMVEEARATSHGVVTYGPADFLVHDVAALPFTERRFDWCVCRGVEGSTKSLVSVVKWERMLAEMLRVSRNVLLIDSEMNHRVLGEGGI